VTPTDPAVCAGRPSIRAPRQSAALRLRNTASTIRSRTGVWDIPRVEYRYAAIRLHHHVGNRPASDACAADDDLHNEPALRRRRKCAGASFDRTPVNSTRPLRFRRLLLEHVHTLPPMSFSVDALPGRSFWVPLSRWKPFVRASAQSVRHGRDLQAPGAPASRRG
jgi:hypothetical protein